MPYSTAARERCSSSMMRFACTEFLSVIDRWRSCRRPFAASCTLAPGPQPDRRRREVDDTGEQLIEFGSSVGTEHWIAVAEKRVVDRLPVGDGKILFRHRQGLLFLCSHMFRMKRRIGFHCRQKAGELCPAALLVARECLLECANLLGAHPMLCLQPIEQRRSLRVTHAQEPVKVLVFLGVVEAL